METAPAVEEKQYLKHKFARWSRIPAVAGTAETGMNAHIPALIAEELVSIV
jgi:hypothetical protein